MYGKIKSLSISVGLQRSVFSLSFLLVFLFQTIQAQGVKISENEATVQNVVPSAILELESSTKGVLIPRVADTNDVTNPVEGLLVYDTQDKVVYFRSNGRWVSTAGNSSTIEGVLMRGNDAGGRNVLGLDTVVANAVSIPRDLKVNALTGQEQIMVQVEGGTIRPMDIAAFFRPRVFSKELRPTPSEAPRLNTVSGGDPTNRTIYYTYKAYGLNADQVSLQFIQKSISNPTYMSNIYGEEGEPNFILNLPDGVSMEYLYVSGPNGCFSQKIKDTPSTKAMRFHILHTGSDTTVFNKSITNGIRSGVSIADDHTFLRDFYIPIFKVVIIPEAITYNGGGSQASSLGVGYVDDWVSIQTSSSPVTGSDSDADDNTITTKGGQDVLLRTSSPAVTDVSNIDDMSPMGRHPMVHAQYISSDRQRTIIGLNYMIRHYGFNKENEALRFSVFF